MAIVSVSRPLPVVVAVGAVARRVVFGILHDPSGVAMSQSLTAADFARCMGHTTTPAMEADVLDAPLAATDEEVSAYLIAVHRNQFAVNSARTEVRAAAAAKVRAQIDEVQAKPAFRGKKDTIQQLWKRYHWISPE